MLIAVAIVAVVAAIAFPSYASARRRGDVSQSFAQLHALGVAQEMYASDWDGIYAVRQSDFHPTWMRKLAPHFPGVFSIRPPLYNPGPFPVSAPGGEGSNGYVVNACLDPRCRGAFTDQARTVMMAETTSIGQYLGNILGSATSLELARPDAMDVQAELAVNLRVYASRPFASRKYEERGAYLFLDGHTALAREAQFSIAYPDVAHASEMCTRTSASPPIPAGALLYARVGG